MIQFLYNAMKWYLYKLEITMKKLLMFLSLHLYSVFIVVSVTILLPT